MKKDPGEWAAWTAVVILILMFIVWQTILWNASEKKYHPRNFQNCLERLAHEYMRPAGLRRS